MIERWSDLQALGRTGAGGRLQVRDRNFAAPPPKRIVPGSPRDAESHAIKPVRQKIPVPDRGRLSDQDQESRLESVFNVPRVAQHPGHTPSTMGPCSLTRASKAASSRREITLQKLAIGQPGERPFPVQPVDLLEHRPRGWHWPSFLPFVRWLDHPGYCTNGHNQSAISRRLVVFKRRQSPNANVSASFTPASYPANKREQFAANGQSDHPPNPDNRHMGERVCSLLTSRRADRQGAGCIPFESILPRVRRSSLGRTGSRHWESVFARDRRDRRRAHRLRETFKHDSWAATGLYEGPPGDVTRGQTAPAGTGAAACRWAGWADGWLGTRSSCSSALSDLKGLPALGARSRSGAKCSRNAVAREIHRRPSARQSRGREANRFIPALSALLRRCMPARSPMSICTSGKTSW